MTTLKSFLTLIIIACIVSTSFAQKKKSRKWYQPARITIPKKQPTKAPATKRPSRTNIRMSAKTTTASRKIMTSREHVWALTNHPRKHWIKHTGNEIKKRQKQKAPYEYKVSFNHLKAYGKGTVSYGDPKPPQVIINIGLGSKEFTGGLNKWVVSSSPIGEKGNNPRRKQSSIYYFRKIDLGGFIFTHLANHVVVTDTLYVPAAGPGKSSFSSVGTGGRNYIRIIADVIVYESPINLETMNRDRTDYVFAANHFIFKSPHKNLSKQELSPVPPFYYKSVNTVKVHKNPVGKKDKTLLNRLYVYTMDQILDDLLHKRPSDQKMKRLLAEYHVLKTKKVNKTLVEQDKGRIKVIYSRLDEKYSKVMNWLYALEMDRLLTQLQGEGDRWKTDLLISEFQDLRKNKIQGGVLEADLTTRDLFNKTSSNFDNQYGSNDIEESRDLHGLKILVDGTVDQLPGKAFKYYTLPTKASLLPVDNQNTGESTALGTVHFNPTGDAQLELKMEVALNIDNEAVKQIEKTLKSQGLRLEKSFPFHMATIEEQALKINGRTVGKIIPIGQQNIRFELELADDGLSLLQLFKSRIEFKLDYHINGQLKPYTQMITLEIDPSLLENLDVQQPLESFSIIEKSTMTDIIKVASFLDAEQTDEGALNYVVVSLEFTFDDKKVFRGPIRLSSSGTLASIETIDFLKHSENYTVKVRGKAIYENGTRDIEPFETNKQIISIDEDILR